MAKTFVLGIECTAHTFGVGIVETTAKTAGSISPKNTKLLANEFQKKLRALGLSIDTLTAEQLEYLSSWETGT